MRRTASAIIFAGLCVQAAVAAAQGTYGIEDLPEEVRRQLPPGAVLEGPPMSDGVIVYSEPRPPETRIAAASVPLAGGAVVAEGSTAVPEARFVSGGKTVTGAPFRYAIPAGSYFAELRGPDGLRRCLAREPYVGYKPPEDESGAIFPGVCLLDRDGDGRFEAARFLPYRPDRFRPRDVPTDPVVLKPAPAAEDPRAPVPVARRRIRVAAVTEATATFQVEDAMAFTHQKHPADYVEGGERSVSILLEPGAQAEIAGLTLKLEGRPGAWRIVPGGSFAPWVELAADGTELNLGALRVGPRNH